MGLRKKRSTASQDMNGAGETAPRGDPALPGTCGYRGTEGYHHRLPTDTNPTGMTFLRPDGKTEPKRPGPVAGPAAERQRLLSGAPSHRVAESRQDEHDPHDPRGGRTNRTGPQGTAGQEEWQKSNVGEEAVREASAQAASVT